MSDLAGAIPGGWGHVWAPSPSGPWAIIAGLAHGWILSRSGSCEEYPVSEVSVLCGGGDVGVLVDAEITQPPGSAPYAVREPMTGCLSR